VIRRLFDHIDLRVRDIREAEPFYSKVMPALGFPIRVEENSGVSYDARREHPKPEFISLIEDPQHVANKTRIAFWCDSREEVDAFAPVLAACPARNVEGPMLCEEYSASYYAVFFEDPCGNRFEVCCRVVPPPGEKT